MLVDDPAGRVPRRSPASRRWSRAAWPSRRRAAGPLPGAEPARSSPRGDALDRRSCSATGPPRCGSPNLRDALWSAATYAAAIAIGAAALRAMEIPRLIGPALLTLAFYLWDALARHARRRAAATCAGSGRPACSPRLGVVVTAWNLLLRP